jgi:hypothetical protein
MIIIPRIFSGLIPLLIFLPNLILMFAPPSSDTIPERSQKTKSYRAIEAIEWISRIAVLVIPFYCSIFLQTYIEFASAIIMLFAMLLYYAGWLRYIFGGRDYHLLYSSLWEAPLPMAISPVIYFLLASVILHTPLLALAAIIFGAAHIYISRLERNRIISI